MKKGDKLICIRNVSVRIQSLNTLTYYFKEGNEYEILYVFNQTRFCIGLVGANFTTNEHYSSIHDKTNMFLYFCTKEELRLKKLKTILQ